ncbi:MAG: hypothetical protein N3D11_14220 [Candidatus Sumerlaeia bacterium]|nr:hypothetical protein [Candidatus Sumerlaeia bacterium]
MPSQWRSWLVRVAAGVALVSAAGFALFWVKFAVEARRAWLAGEQALRDGKEAEAQASFERAIRSHCPFNVWGRQAAAKLQEMAEGHEKAGNLERAVSLYESLMTSLAAIDTGWSRARKEILAALEKKTLTLRREISAQPTSKK